ncbi:hypothetical protein OG338_09430 [Streptomyces sp. NBC_00726]|uniref:hypothetical protein n=1 Tax=Streptomyces sp. NBC_00726 TaxID=2903674 RepID=UPI003864F3A8
MRSIPLTFCAAALAAATLVPIPAALAESGSGHEDSRSRAALSVSPSSVAPGGRVGLELSGCKAKEAEGSSDAFVSDARFSSGDGRTLHAEARVRADAEPGDYDVRATCDKHTRVTATFTVVHRERPMPVAPVHAGGGGTAVLAGKAAEQDGPGTVHEVIGLGLAAVAAVAVALRSVRRRRPAAD